MIENSINLDKIFKYAQENFVSDIHVVEDEKIFFRIFGEIKESKFSSLSRSEILEICGEYENDLDFIYTDKENNRYRINYFKTKNKLAFVARLIKEKAIFIDDDFFNELVEEKILKLKNGLILVTGATGSGKSTTLANIIEKFNETKNYKILTLENPIEYIFENKKSLVIQREIGKDVSSFQMALKSSLRQDPNIIMVGEIRDVESLYATLTLAETGHLVLSTLHTTSAIESINRIISMVESDKKDYIRIQLSSVLRFIFSQELYKDKNNKKIRVLFEVLNNTKAVSSLIFNNKINQIQNMIESGKENYMISMKKYKEKYNIMEENS